MHLEKSLDTIVRRHGISLWIICTHSNVHIYLSFGVHINIKLVHLTLSVSSKIDHTQEWLGELLKSIDPQAGLGPGKVKLNATPFQVNLM